MTHEEFLELTRLRSKLNSYRQENKELQSQIPHWISVEDELPKKDGRYLFYDEVLGPQVSVYYDGCTLVSSITHWMPLPDSPILSNSSNTGKKSNFDENCEKYRTVFDGWEDLTFEERRDRINKFRSGQW